MGARPLDHADARNLREERRLRHHVCLLDFSFSSWCFRSVTLFCLDARFSGLRTGLQGRICLWRPQCSRMQGPSGAPRIWDTSRSTSRPSCRLLRGSLRPAGRGGSRVEGLLYLRLGVRWRTPVGRVVICHPDDCHAVLPSMRVSPRDFDGHQRVARPMHDPRGTWHLRLLGMLLIVCHHAPMHLQAAKGPRPSCLPISQRAT